MFYIIEKESQLEVIDFGKECFLEVIGNNNNYHPIKQHISLIYIFPIGQDKSYILCIDHSESLSLDINKVFSKLKTIEDIYVLDKKRHLYFLNDDFNLIDINFKKYIPLENIKLIDLYESRYAHELYLNHIIPISKHHEKWDNFYYKNLMELLPFERDDRFNFNNESSKIFYDVEKNGINLDKEKFIEYFWKKLTYPEYNILEGKIYTSYNLYNTTSRPSNTFNNINFLAIKKSEIRESFIPANDYLVDIDFNGYHPRIIADLIGYTFDHTNLYDQIKIGLPEEVCANIKEFTFKQIYGGINKKYLEHPFFSKIDNYIKNNIKNKHYIYTENNILNIKDINPQKSFNYIIQNRETINNVKFLKSINNLLAGLESFIILYTYDSFLIDIKKEEMWVIKEIQKLLLYPTKVKIGKNYKNLEYYE